METGASWMGEPAGDPAGSQGWGIPGGEVKPGQGKKWGAGGNEVLQAGPRAQTFRRAWAPLSDRHTCGSSSKTDCVTLSK